MLFSSLAVLLVASVTGLLLGLGLDNIFLRHVGHDQSWCVYAADLVLHGVQLNGPELVEVNPPFIVWFSCIPVLLGNLFHLGILNGFRLFFDLSALVSLLWTNTLLTRFFRPSALSLWLFALTQTVTSFWLIQKDSLGQREQLLVLLLLPYLVLAAARLREQTTGVIHSLLIGSAAGIAVCIKPQHVLDVIAVELLILIWLRKPRSLLNPATVAFALTLMLYVASVYAFGRTYFQEVVPELRMAYWGLNGTLGAVLKQAAPVATGLIVCWIAFLALRQRLGFATLGLVLGLSATGSLLAYVQQHKGWSYQLIPAGLLTVLFIATALIGFLESWAGTERAAPDSRGERIVPAWAAALGCLLLSGFFGWHMRPRPGYFSEKKRILAQFWAPYPEGSAVSYIATEPWDMPLILDQHKVLGQRVNYFWMLPAIILGQDPQNRLHHPTMPPAEIEQLSNLQRHTMAEDLVRWRPVIVVVDQCGPELCPSLKREHYDTVVNWFTRDPEFAHEWQHYRSVGKQGDLEAFRRAN